MQVNYTMDKFKNVGFFAVPSEQDGFPPLLSLTTELAPTFFSGGRSGLACAMAFGTFTSGVLSFKNKITPLTANLFQQLLPDGELFVDTSSIDFKPTDMQLGESTLHVATGDSLSKLVEFAEEVVALPGNNTYLCVVRNDGVKGYLASPRGRIVPSNYWLRSELTSPSDSLMALCSLALMYSEDLGVGRISLHNPPVVDEGFLSAVEKVLYSVGISLERNN